MCFNTRKFLSDHYRYAHKAIVSHHDKTNTWSRTSLVDELVARMVRMRGLEFPDSGLALDKLVDSILDKAGSQFTKRIFLVERNCR